MQAALEAGEHKKFFEIWSEVIPQHIRLSEGHKIEFYINVSLLRRKFFFFFLLKYGEVIPQQSGSLKVTKSNFI